MTIPEHIQQAIQAYYAERATDEQIAALEDWLREDEAHVRHFAEHGLLEWQLLCESEKADAAAILSMLRQAEENAEPILVDASKPNEPVAFTDARSAEDKMTLGEIGSTTAYLIGQALRTKPAILAYAAIITITAAALLIPWNNTTPSPNMPTASENPMPWDNEPTTTPQTVATLTATHNAVWDQKPQEHLLAGQSLTLTQGFAEITTTRGAIAILEAPATIELLNNDNALRLQTGKLVGICETELSKGFTVYTDNAEVTDIGTVFGVERDALGQTTVGVLSGHVTLSYKASDEPPRLLKAGDVSGVSADGLAMSEPPAADIAERLRVWGNLLRPVTVTGDATFVENMPAELHQDNELVRVYREPAGVLLEQDLRVSRTETGLYRPTEPTGQFTVPAGMRVDSYFVHIDRPQRPISRISRTFTITFDQPVVALIVHTDLLIDSNGTLGNSGTRYLKAGGLGLVSKSGFESDAPQVDSIDWSEDRKTLRVTLNVEDADQFRVLTLSPEAASAAGNRE